MEVVSAQNLYDQIVTHLRKQGKRAYDDVNDRCVYRAKDGSQCAAGCVIRDNEYDKWMEGKSILEVIGDYCCPSSLQLRLREHKAMLTYFQGIHDNAPVNEWEWHFKHAADSYHLVYTPQSSATETP